VPTPESDRQPSFGRPIDLPEQSMLDRLDLRQSVGEVRHTRVVTAMAYGRALACHDKAVDIEAFGNRIGRIPAFGLVFRWIQDVATARTSSQY